jgi:hypothetical protein
MAQSDKDNLADALARLADGDIAPSEQEPAAPGDEIAAPSATKPLRAAAPAEFDLPSPPPPPMPAIPQRAHFESAADAVEQIVDGDDDETSMPAPDADVFAPRHHAARRAAVYQTLEFRRTLIPILLTCGALLIAFASARHLVGPDSPLADLPPWMAPVLILSGTVLLALAGLNMLSVKSRMAEHELRVDKLRRRLL